MIDGREIIDIQRKMEGSANEILAMTDEVGDSKTTKEFSSDRKRQLLSRYEAPLILVGKSAAAAQILAEADERYIAEFGAIEDQYRSAERHIAKWDAKHCVFEAARSLLSLAKESMRM